MSLVINTEQLIDLLSTLVATAGDESYNGGALLYTAHGEFGDEPGQRQLLAGISTNDTVSSHYYVPVDGGTFKASFWPSFAAGFVENAFGARAADREDHALRITQLPDGQVEIKEYDEPSDGVKIVFNLLDADDFPAEGVVRLLRGERIRQEVVGSDEVPIVDGPTALWDMNGLGLLLRLSKKWKSRLILQKTVTGGVHRVAMTGMENWLGAVVPPVPDEAVELNGGVAVEAYLDVAAELKGR